MHQTDREYEEVFHNSRRHERNTHKGNNVLVRNHEKTQERNVTEELSSCSVY